MGLIGLFFLGMIRVDCLGLVLHLGLLVWGPLFGVSCLVFWDWLFEAGWLSEDGWLVG